MKKDEHEIQDTPSVAGISGQPETIFELLNKYGTYNIQPTADNENDYPKIAQGLPEEEAEKAKEKKFGEK
ncbi:MAG: hypothetical protein MJ147_01795 [Clostridia bacterium]|nr:hypothetical protein [Clostridia bacterium]